MEKTEANNYPRSILKRKASFKKITRGNKAGQGKSTKVYHSNG